MRTLPQRRPILAPGARLLGLDPSFGATGWSVGSLDAEPVSGVFKSCTGSTRQQLSQFWDQLGALHGRYKFAFCWFEHQEVIYLPHTNLTEGSRFRLQAAIELAGHICRFVTVPVQSNVWRKDFLGLALAPKDRRNRGSSRTWLKARAIDECRRMGWHVTSDDEAEARGIMVHGLSVMSDSYAARMAGPLTRYPRKNAA